MKHARLARLPVPAEVAGVVLEPGETAFLPARECEPLDLGHCFRSGQIFRWRQIGDTWYGPFGLSALALTAVAGGVRVEAAGAPVGLSDVYRFLALDAPLAALQAAITTDRHLRTSIAAFQGLRILRQEPWECLATYLCSQWNNIPKIEGSTEKLARRWGRTHTFRRNGVEVAAFPSPEALASRTIDDLRACALGYRCRYLIDTARLLADGEFDPAALRRLSYDDALRALLGLPGIGRKVADCILLFALDRWEAFPVDVWVRRIAHELYPVAVRLQLPDQDRRREKGLSNIEYRALVQFARHRWGALAGWAQEYLFCARRAGVI